MRPLFTAALVAAALIPLPFAYAAPGHAPGEIIVKFKQNASPSEKQQIRAEVGGQKIKEWGRIRAELQHVEGMTVEEAVQRLQGHPRVEYVEPNYTLEIDKVPDDPLFFLLWGLQNTGQEGGIPGSDIGAVEAWDISTGSTDVLVGVIDTGVDYLHSDLAANIWTNPGEIPDNGIDDDNNGYIDDVHGWDFYNHDNDPMDDHHHGTHCAGIIGALGNNEIGVVGVCWSIKLLPLKFIGADGYGYTSDAVDAVEYATMMGVRLTSNSWGGGDYSQALYDAIEEADQAGILFVAGAANYASDNDAVPTYPAAYDLSNIVAVAATDENDLLADFSNYGAVTVDLCAPGVNILSTFPGDQYAHLSGTSMATPHVAGALGLIFSRFPGIGHMDAKSLLLSSVDPIPSLAGVCATGGRLNAYTPLAQTDDIAPGEISDLTVSAVASNSVELSWTAPGNDGYSGTAGQYDVRYSTSPIDMSNYDSADQAEGEPLPHLVGTPEAMIVGGLNQSTTYYFAIKARDAFGNAGGLSNVPQGTTLGPPQLAVSPLSITEELLIGATSVHSLTLSNLVPNTTLAFEIRLPESLGSPMPVFPYEQIGKDETDTRTGDAVPQGVGGPDGFGYRWADSDDVLGPSFDWNDISLTGTPILTAGDDVIDGPHALGFDFSFYGSAYNEIRISSNGWLSFFSTSTDYNNQLLPNAGAPAAMIAPFWDDLVVDSGSIYFETDGTRAIVQWNNVNHYNAGGPYTFQAILNGDGSIEFQYLAMDSPVNSATIGMQNRARSDGLNLAFNTAYIHDHLAVRIAATPPWLAVTPEAGSITGADSRTLEVQLDATGLLGGTYEADIGILSNDPEAAFSVVPVQFTVIGAPDIRVDPLAYNYGSVAVGTTAAHGFLLSNAGSDTLYISGITVADPVYLPDETTFAVLPQESHTVVVSFSPVDLVSYPAVMTITTNDPDQPAVSVQLSGEGSTLPALSVSPTTLTSNLGIGGSETQALTLSNTGDAELDWTIGQSVHSSLQAYSLAPPVNGPDVDTGVEEAQIFAEPVEMELQDLSGIHILWDRGHGQVSQGAWTSLVGDFTARGATVSESNDSLTPALLAEYDVLWSVDVNVAFGPDELTALADWIHAGGGLLLEGDNLATISIYNQLLGNLGAGFQYVSSPVSGGNALPVHPHPTTENVSAVYFSSSSAMVDGSLTALAEPLVLDVNGLIGVAAGRAGSGRIVGATDEIFQNGRLDNADNRLFGNQVMDWISEPTFTALEPARGTIPVGGSETVSVTFNASDLPGGRYEAELELVTNDPLAARVNVPAVMIVTGTPDIAVEPLSLNFGTAYASYPKELAFSITNAGTDRLTVSALDSSNPRFQIDLSDIHLPLELSPQETVLIGVAFIPDLPQGESGFLSIASNDTDQPTVDIAVAGQGAVPPLAEVNPDSLHTDLLSGQSDIRQVTLSNTGNGDLTWKTSVASLAYRSADLTGTRIMWDRRHGQQSDGVASTLVGDLKSRGATVTVNLSSWSWAVLTGYDVVWFGDADTELSYTETTALISWINAGGGLLLQGDNLATIEIYNHILTSLDAGFRYKPSPMSGGNATLIHSHPATEGVQEVNFFPSSASITDIEAPGQPLVEDDNKSVGVAVSSVGTGQIVGVSDQLFHDNRIVVADNRLLANQIMDWMSRRVVFSISPPSGQIPPGESRLLDVAFNAQSLLGGHYSGLLSFLSNDPADPVLDVALTMQVTGVPQIALEPEILDLDTAFLGYPVSATLAVSSVGTDLLTVTSILAGLPDWSADPSSLSLAPGESAEIQVTLDPQSVGDLSTSLIIESNDPDSPHAVQLVGAGAQAPLAEVFPESLHTDLQAGGTVTQPLTLSNTGFSDLAWNAAITSFDHQTEPGTSSFHFMWDRAHGQANTGDWSKMITGLESRGAVVAVNQNSWTPASLSAYDVIWFGDATAALTAVEAEALTDWIGAGGGLLLQGDNLATVGIYNQMLTALGAPFQYVSSPVSPGFVTPITPHPVTEDVNSVFFSSSSASIREITPTGVALVGDTEGVVGVAAGVFGAGKILGVSDELFQNSWIDNDDNHRLVNQAVDWLAQEVPFSVVPLGGVLPAGASTPLDVTFHPPETSVGSYSGVVTLLSNDPVRPVLNVPVTMQVTGVPLLTWEPNPLDLGVQFPGHPYTKELTLSNGGTVPLNISSISAGLPDWSAAPSSLTLDAGEAAAIDVTFDPQALGSRNTVLTVTSNDTDSPHTIPCLGTGAVAPLAGISPDSLHADLVTGETETQKATLSNAGQSDLVWEAWIAGNIQAYTFQAPLPAGTVTDIDTGEPNLNPDRSEPLQANLADLTGVEIMWDASHGQPESVYWTALIADLESRGALVRTNHFIWTQGLLSSYDVIWSGDVNETFSTPERQALTSWLEAGGGLVLEGDNMATVAIYNQILTALGAGLQYVSSPVKPGDASTIYAHTVTQNIDAVHFSSSSSSIGGITSPGSPLVEDSGGVVGVAVSRVGSGRIIGASDELFQNANIGHADNELLANQIIDWMAQKAFVSVSPHAGKVPPGESSVLNFTFNAQGASAGDQFGVVTIFSNDPINPRLNVAATLHVTAAPRVALDLKYLDFGSILVGYPESMTFTLSNVGSELLTVADMTPGLPGWSANPSTLTLAPLEAAQVEVLFDPVSSGDFTTQLTIASNDPDSPHKISLYGTGVIPPVAALSPESMHADLSTGERDIQPATLSNAGGSPLVWHANFTDLGNESNPVYTLQAPGIASDVDTGAPNLNPDHAESIQAELGDLTGIRILWDRTHGQPRRGDWSTLISDLHSRGATVIDREEPWTPSWLAEYNLIWLLDMDLPLTDTETENLSAWIAGGGGLLLEGANVATVPIYNQILSSLNAGFRYAFSRVDPGEATAIHAHPTTATVNAVSFSSSSASIDEILVPAESLVEDGNGVVGAAASVVGPGRIVGVSDALFQNSHIDNADNRVFGNQIVDWLTSHAAFFVSPHSGVVYPGGSEVLSVTFDAEALPGGSYSRVLTVSTNDPANPNLELPVTMQVTAAPRLALQSALLDFGEQFVGYPDTLSLTILNFGSKPLTVASITSSRGDWTVSPSSLEVGAGASAMLAVVFAPLTDGDRGAELTLVSDDPDSPHLVSLHGQALHPPIVVSTPDALESTAPPGSTAGKTLALCNTGGSDLVWSTSLAPLRQPFNPSPPDPYESTPDVASGMPNPEAGPTQPIQAGPADLAGIHIMWDRSHGQTSTSAWSILVQDVESRGATVTVNNEPWTQAVLAEYNVVWLVETHTAPTPAELSAFSDWVTGGGSFLLEGDDDASVPVYNEVLGTLGAGFEYSTTSGTSGPTPRIFPHPTTEGVQRIYLTGIAASLTNIAPPGGLLFNDFRGGHVGAYSQVGYGHLVCVSDEVFQNSRMDNDDNRLFGNQVMDWLALSPVSWLSVSPMDGLLPAGECTDLSVTMDGTDLVAGDYVGTLILNSNAPGLPHDEMLITFHVGLVEAAFLDVDPNAVNPGSNGNWVTAHVELPPEYDPRKIVPETVTLNGIPAAPSKVSFGDFNKNAIPDATFKFERGAFEAALPEGDAVAAVLTGEVEDTIWFTGTDSLRVIRPRLVFPNGGETVGTGLPMGIHWENPAGWVVDHADLYYSANAGETWSLITQGVAEATSYTWTLPDEETDQALIRVFLFDSQDIMGYGTSEEPFAVSAGVVAADDPAPTIYALLQNAPNPFRGPTQITFDLPQEEHVDLRIYDVQGRLVRILKNTILPQGRHQADWDGRDAAGARAPLGVYFYRLKAGSFTATRQMTLIR